MAQTFYMNSANPKVPQNPKLPNSPTHPSHRPAAWKFRRVCAVSSLILRRNPAARLNGALLATGHHNYSASSDNNMLQAIQSAMDCKLNKHLFEAVVAEAPEDFPFKIEHCVDLVTLVREYNGETITVEVVRGKPDDEDKDKSSDSKLSVVVGVAKKNGASQLYFSCTAVPDEFRVDRLSMHFPEEDVYMYDASYVISEFDESLQKALYEYLEKRGVNLSTTNFLRKYLTTYLTMNEDDRKDLSWLKLLINFVKL